MTTVSIPSFADAEVPSGTIDGKNATFKLANAPNPAASLLLFRNGARQHCPCDCTLAGATLTFVPAAIPQPNDQLIAHYRY